MPGGIGPGQLIPGGGLPTEVPGGRARHQGRVGHPAADDDVGTRLQGAGNAPAAQIGVGGYGQRPGISQAGSFIKVGEGLSLGL